jgi:sulfotransferase
VGKQYNFLAGFFRSGNTVLSSILNQHPEIYSSPLSILVEHVWQSHVVLNNFETSKANKQSYERSKRLTLDMPDTYYRDVEKNIIFDRCKVWTNPDNILLIKEYITKNPKIVFTTRPVIEMMASFIAIAKDVIISDMNDSNFAPNKDLPMNDNLADFLYSEYSNFGKQLRWAFQSIDNPDNAGIIYIVKYQDLLDTPQETMNAIYDFLEIESFQHNFKNIRKIEEYNEAAVELPKDLHKVRRVLGRSDVRVKDYLTPRSIEKYKDARYF